MFSPKSAPVLTPPDGIGGGKPAKPNPKPTPSPILPPTPPGPPTQDTPPTQRSTGQESKSDSGKQSESSRDKSDNRNTTGKPPDREPSISGFPQDIEWSPEFEARGILPIMQAAVDGIRDSSEDKTTAVCAALLRGQPGSCRPRSDDHDGLRA